ncbi:MAG: hypothetical protein L6R39_003383 [Caloplaca ligustica]|nr:MAG: hypothetical protein L6R39_003383 [Caloplaca ligustica]
MCYHDVEKFGCGHEDKHKIPCEEFCEKGHCSKLEEDRIREDAGSICNKCKDKEEEDEFMEEELRKFAERESLDRSAAPPRRTRDPNAPTLYFKRCIVWNKCHHYSHPRPSDIERDEGDPEYLPVEGLGNCFDCSAAPASVIQQMKQNGDFDKEDPWGAMSRTEVAEGSSRGADLPSLEEIAYGMKHSDSDQHAAVSPPSSPEMTGGRPRSAGSLESDDDLGPAKGKGRLGEPIRQPAHAAMVDSDESDTEETPHNKSKKSGHLVMHQAEEETDSEAGTADEEDDEEDKVSHRLHQSKERPPHAPSVSDDDEDDEKHFSGNEEAHGKAPRWGQGTAHHTDSDEEFDPGSDGLSDAESDGEDEHGQNDKHSNKGKAAGAPTIIKKT